MPGNSPTKNASPASSANERTAPPHGTDTRVALPGTLPKASSGCRLPHPWAGLKSKPGQTELAAPALALPNRLLSPRFIYNPVEKNLVLIPLGSAGVSKSLSLQHQHIPVSVPLRQSVWRALGQAGRQSISTNKTIGTAHRPEGFLVQGLNFPEKQRTIPCTMH